MSTLAAALVAVAVGAAGWDGYRRGRRRALLLGSALLAGALLALVAGLVLRHLGIGASSLVVIALSAVAVLVLRRGCLARCAREDDVADGRAWRWAGVALSGVVALILCQLLAAGLVLMAGPAPEPALAQPASAAAPVAAAADPWAGVRALGSELGSISGSLLATVPVVGPRSERMAAMLRILRASPAQRARLASHPDLRRLVTSPAVLAALADEGLLADIDALADGELQALERITEHPRIIALSEDPLIREAVARIDLVELSQRIDRE